MIFFLIGSLAPQITRLSSSPVRCPSCLDPSPTVFLNKSQNKLSVFFIPVWWFKPKYLWICERCKWTGSTRPNDEQVRQREEAELTLRQRQPLPTWGLRKCKTCDKEINVSGRIKYCPYCGSPVQV
ncbi:zinc ribbon domain-containing protein [Gigaspora margarita]|uniref:Zinc ribbon domain-containing protein n=1 Tax=Gigaspora margarita TaxID=4874 RepID=A0A8H4EJ00_GIGMA|nr:zinc ribbon domain-containing protein [Gigaspora margarita]